MVHDVWTSMQRVQTGTLEMSVFYVAFCEYFENDANLHLASLFEPSRLCRIQSGTPVRVLP